MIELLVVIMIIGLLVGILLPVLSSSKSSAKIVVCQSNMKQIGRAIFTYQNDAENDAFPPHSSMPPPFTINAAGHPPYTRFLYDYLDPYIPAQSKVYECPADEGVVYEKCFALSANNTGLSYYYFGPPDVFEDILFDFSGDTENGAWPGFHRGKQNTLAADLNVRLSD